MTNRDWKETVIPTPDHSESVYCAHCGEESGQETYIEIIRENQAQHTGEIAFKAGEQEGVRKVVGYISKNNVWTRREGLLVKYFALDSMEWQAQLKIWFKDNPEGG